MRGKLVKIYEKWEVKKNIWKFTKIFENILNLWKVFRIYENMLKSMKFQMRFTYNSKFGKVHKSKIFLKIFEILIESLKVY